MHLKNHGGFHRDGFLSWEIMDILQMGWGSSSHFLTRSFLSIHLLPTHFFCCYKKNPMFYDENLSVAKWTEHHLKKVLEIAFCVFAEFVARPYAAEFL